MYCVDQIASCSLIVNWTLNYVAVIMCGVLILDCLEQTRTCEILWWRFFRFFFQTSRLFWQIRFMEIVRNSLIMSKWKIMKSRRRMNFYGRCLVLCTDLKSHGNEFYLKYFWYSKYPQIPENPIPINRGDQIFHRTHFSSGDMKGRREDSLGVAYQKDKKLLIKHI